jgi:DNA modification methylase
LIWAKNAPGFGRTDYHYKHEPIIYGWLEGGGTHYFADDHTRTTLIEAQKPLHSLEHPTMKPIELITQMIEVSSCSGEIVYEPFDGSGSTLVACEQLNRFGRGIELSEKYVAVALERLAGMGLEPRKTD